MITKSTFAITAALVLASVSGAFAGVAGLSNRPADWNNIGQINYDVARHGMDAYAAAPRALSAPRAQNFDNKVLIDRPTANISSY